MFTSDILCRNNCIDARQIVESLAVNFSENRWKTVPVINLYVLAEKPCYDFALTGEHKDVIYVLGLVHPAALHETLKLIPEWGIYSTLIEREALFITTGHYRFK